MMLPSSEMLAEERKKNKEEKKNLEIEEHKTGEGKGKKCLKARHD